MGDRSPALSVAIVNWNTRDLLLQALESIYSGEPDLPIELLVVDNGSQDGSADAVRERFPQVTLLAEPTNSGYAHGNNLAIARAGAPYVLLLNPDVIVPPLALTRAVAFMEVHPEAGALGVLQRFPGGEIQSSVRSFPSPIPVLWELVGFSRLFRRSRLFGAYRMTWFDYDRVIEVDQPMGTFLLMRAEALRRVGALDERFPIFFNEVDWCYRCKRAGWRIYFTPEVEIVHYGGSSTAQVGPAMAWESRRGLLDFYARHYRAPWQRPMRLVVAAASWPHAWLQARRRRPKSR